MDRREKILHGIDWKNKKGLEIWPLCKPLVSKAEAKNLIYLDYLSTEELREKYKYSPSIKNLVNVDYVANSSQPLKSLLQRELPFHYIIASHVIEHVPNPILWLRELYDLLEDGGIIALAIPDKRFCFDYLRHTSTTSDWVQAYVTHVDQPTPNAVFSHIHNAVHYHHRTAWGHQVQKSDLKKVHTLHQAFQQAKKSAEGEYIDVHSWVLTPLSFFEIFKDLTQLEILKFKVYSYYETTGHEFFVSLIKSSDETKEILLSSIPTVIAEESVESIKKSSNQPKKLQELSSKYQTMLTEMQNIRSHLYQIRDQFQGSITSDDENNKTRSVLSHSIIESKQLTIETTAKLGIGIITYNRLDHLKNCVERLRNFTTVPYYLVVADDGSLDGSVEWCYEQGLPIITGQNHGVVWNKNRALYALMNYTDADTIILLEDDCWPASETWAQEWCEAVQQWHHLNFAHPGLLKRPGAIRAGAGNPANPYKSMLVTGQCTGCSRHAMQSVGYLDTRFQGYGHGHVEWTRRFIRGDLSRVELPGIDQNRMIYLCITGGLESRDAPTYCSQEELKHNQQVFESILDELVYRNPWQNDQEKSQLIEEIQSCLKVVQNRYSPENLSQNFNNQIRLPVQKYQKIKLGEKAMKVQNTAKVSEIIRLINNSSSLILGSCLDEPQKGVEKDSKTLKFAGWVIGKEARATTIELICNGKIIDTIPVERPRPDVGRVYPQKPESSQSGFSGSITGDADLLESDVLVQAILENQTRFPIYLVRFGSTPTSENKNSILNGYSPLKKRDITQLFQTQEQQIRQLLLNEYRQIESLMNLHSLIQLSNPLPPLRVWVASPDLAVLIYSLIIDRKVQNVLELGSGASSLIIGYALQQLGRGKVVSLEHDQKYVSSSVDLVKKHQLNDYCKVEYAPLVQTNINDKNYKFYSLDSLKDGEKFDMLVIDGPPGSSNPMARFPAIPLLYERLSSQALVVLDDASRRDEKLAVKEWLQNYNLETLTTPQTEKGVAVILKTSS